MNFRSLAPALILGVLSLALVSPAAHAQLTVLDQFNPNQGQLVGVGFNSATDNVFVYGGFNASIQRLSRNGTLLSSIARPGEGANDADIDFATQSFTLGSTLVPLGSLLFVNGETGFADIYAVDPLTGAVIASLTTSFGNSHVVGIAYHEARNSFFLVADQLDSVNPSTIAEINPLTGSVLSRFGTGSGYTVNFGDIDVNRNTGNLLLVSSDEAAVREFSATGVFIRDLALPGGVNSLSGIAIDEQRGEAFLSGTDGTVWRVGGLAAANTAAPEPGSIALLLTVGLPVVGIVRRRRKR